MSDDRKIEVVNGNGDDLEISPVYDHLDIEKPNTENKKEIIIPKEKKKEEDNDELFENDELLDEAIKLVVEYQQASTSFIQRKLRIGFNRASRIMEELEAKGIISERDGSKPRQVLIAKDEIYNEQ